MAASTFVRRRPRLRSGAALAVSALLLAACGADTDTGASGSTSATTDTSATDTATPDPSASGSSPAAEPGQAGGEVVLLTHDSFDLDEQVLADFEAESGLTVTLLAQGDAGSMTNTLVLTKDNPLGDVVFGIDNTFASRALDAGVLAPYRSPLADRGSADHAVTVDGVADDRLSAVDVGDVCVNVDHEWFAEKGLAEPTSFQDLTDPAYQDLFVAPSPATSSVGLAFLLGTVAEFGPDGWQQYWSDLVDNGVKVTSGWTDAYTVDFSGSSGEGDRPLVVSYASSPPFEVTDENATQSPTGALLDTCFRQVEYAGVLEGAKNPEGARKVVDFLLGEAFQTGLPDAMYVHPVDTEVELPEQWARFAPLPDSPRTLEPAQIAQHREAWISEWTDLVEG